MFMPPPLGDGGIIFSRYASVVSSAWLFVCVHRQIFRQYIDKHASKSLKCGKLGYPGHLQNWLDLFFVDFP